MIEEGEKETHFTVMGKDIHDTRMLIYDPEFTGDIYD
jgi:hypothetical protein